MLRQQLPRAAAAASLVIAPLLGLVAACAWPPLRAGDRAQITAISAQPGRWYIFSLFLLLSTIMLVPAVLALMRLLGRSRPTWALIAGCAAQLGILIGVGDAATNLMFWQMGSRGASLGQMAALATRYNAAPGAALIFMIGGLATLSGTLALSAGLWRAHAVPAWTAIAVAVAMIANIAGLSVIAPGATGGERVHVTVSIGVAALDSGSKREYAELMAAADAALYRAKSGGRDQVQMISTTRGLSAISGGGRGSDSSGANGNGGTNSTSGSRTDVPSVFRRAQN